MCATIQVLPTDLKRVLLIVVVISVRLLHSNLSCGLFFVCRQESIRTAFLLSQGGEFAFVLLSLANELKVLPTDLNRLLIIVVVLSMALTPFLAEAGKRFAESTVENDSDGVSLFHDLVHCHSTLK